MRAIMLALLLASSPSVLAGEWFLGAGIYHDTFNENGQPWGRIYGGYAWQDVLKERDELAVQCDHWSGITTQDPFNRQVNACGTNYEVRW